MSRLSTQVPQAIHRATYQSMSRRPNVFECEVHRKQVTRVTPTTINDLPTIGGMGQLSGEDETEYDFVLIGNALLQFIGPFNGMYVSDSGESLAGLEPDPMEAIIVSEHPTGTLEYFEIMRSDLILMKYDIDNVIPFTVSETISPINIPSFQKRFVIQRFDDLLYVNPDLTDSLT